MKKTITLLIGILFSLSILNSQIAPPQAFSFKATIVGKSGAIIASKAIGLKICIVKDYADNPIPEYTQTFTPRTNEYGQIDVLIGPNQDIEPDDPWLLIKWSDNIFFLQVWVDIKGGSNYGGTPMSSTQLLSVPYALYSNLAGSALSVDYNDLKNKPVGTQIGDMQYWNGTDWIMIPVGSNGQVLTLLDGVPTWGGSGEVPNQSPILMTNGISDPTPNSFITGGYILSDGGSPISQRGVCWNTTGDPKIEDSKTNDGGGPGGFTSTVTGLTVETTYYVKAYAVNKVGTGYGNEISFTTSQIKVTGITLNSSSMTLLPGETSQLTETITPADAYDKTVVWASSATSVATVTETGLITAIANGITTITATTNDGARTATCEVRVAKYNLHGIITGDLTIEENSVVSVSGMLQIAAGVTVSVGQGTMVFGNGNELQNWGSFVAIGNTSNKITFDNLNLTAKDAGFCDLQYCVYNSGTIFASWGSYRGSLSLKYSEIYDLTSNVMIYNPNSDCLMEGNIFKNTYGFYFMVYENQITFKNNRFEQMKSPSIASAYLTGADIIIQGNSFMDKGQVQIKLEANSTGKDIDAANNFWNTTDPIEISSMIYDKNDDLSCPGYVLFSPFLTSPDPLTP